MCSCTSVHAWAARKSMLFVDACIKSSTRKDERREGATAGRRGWGAQRTAAICPTVLLTQALWCEAGRCGSISAWPCGA